MYQGKHSKKSPRRSRRSKKSMALLVSLVLLVGVAIGGTVAFLSTRTSEVKNTFTPSKVTTQVEETFNGNTKSDVKIKNTGDTEAYIRAAIVVTWKDAAGNIYAGKPVAGSDYEISLNTTDWFLGRDGFYYCKSSVAPNASTAVLINSCYPVSDKTPEGYGLNVEILGSAIQSVPVNVVAEKWGVTVNADGTLSQ